jgi:hypothetical protein
MIFPYFSLSMQYLKVFFLFIPFIKKHFFLHLFFVILLLCLKSNIKNFIF